MKCRRSDFLTLSCLQAITDGGDVGGAASRYTERRRQLSMNLDSIHPRDQTDEQLLERCRWEAFRGSGPGGQKRNKTSSAVRVVHEPTEISATASESRSQSVNRRHAYERLRLRIVLEMRKPVDKEGFEPPEWLQQLKGACGRLEVSARNGQFLALAGLLLDCLVATQGSVSDAATLLGVATAQFVRALEVEEKVWIEANRIRSEYGLKPLGVS